jgi:hypothetical protein
MTQMSSECRVKVLLFSPTEVIASCKLGFGFLLAEVPNMRFMVRFRVWPQLWSGNDGPEAIIQFGQLDRIQDNASGRCSSTTMTALFPHVNIENLKKFAADEITPEYPTRSPIKGSKGSKAVARPKPRVLSAEDIVWGGQRVRRASHRMTCAITMCILTDISCAADDFTHVRPSHCAPWSTYNVGARST